MTDRSGVDGHLYTTLVQSTIEVHGVPESELPAHVAKEGEQFALVAGGEVVRYGSVATLTRRQRRLQCLCGYGMGIRKTKILGQQRNALQEVGFGHGVGPPARFSESLQVPGEGRAAVADATGQPCRHGTKRGLSEEEIERESGTLQAQENVRRRGRRHVQLVENAASPTKPQLHPPVDGLAINRPEGEGHPVKTVFGEPPADGERRLPRAPDRVESVHPERRLVEVVVFGEVVQVGEFGQRPVAAEERGLAGAVLADEQGDAPRSRRLRALEAADVSDLDVGDPGHQPPPRPCRSHSRTVRRLTPRSRAASARLKPQTSMVRANDATPRRRSGRSVNASSRPPSGSCTATARSAASSGPRARFGSLIPIVHACFACNRMSTATRYQLCPSVAGLPGSAAARGRDRPRDRAPKRLYDASLLTSVPNGDEYMAITLTVTARGRITLRRGVLEHLGVRPGDEVEVDLLKDGRMQVRAKPGKSVTTLFGMLAKPGTPRRSIEELNEAVAAGWAGEA